MNHLHSSCYLLMASVVTSFDPYAWYPRQYVAQRVTQHLVIDGDVEKEAWRSVPWSDAFGDIQGKDGPSPADIPLTAFKALYDDTHLYICAVLHPKDGLPTEAHFTERNQPIYQKDSDFEVFIQVGYPNEDGSGTTWNHDYKELEINAINTPWNLLMDKPYWDGGQEHSGRVASDPADPLYYEVYHQETATRVLSGQLNHPTHGALWTVEMKLAFSDLWVQKSDTTTPTHQPSLSVPWRINFSRVEKQGAINWTWQPQYRWDPQQNQFRGFVDMHLPDAWGYLSFDQPIIDSTWPAQLAAMCIYYAQRHHQEANGKFTKDVNILILPPHIMDDFRVDIQLEDPDHYVASIVDATGNVHVQIRQDRRLTIVTNRTSAIDQQ